MKNQSFVEQLKFLFSSFFMTISLEHEWLLEVEFEIRKQEKAKKKCISMHDSLQKWYTKTLGLL